MSLLGGLAGAGRAMQDIAKGTMEERRRIRLEGRAAATRKAETAEEREYQSGLLKEKRAYDESVAEKKARSDIGREAVKGSLEAQRQARKFEQEKELVRMKAEKPGGEDRPAAIKIADTIAEKFNVPWQEAWNISQRTKSDPRQASMDLYYKRRKDIEMGDLPEETDEQSWEFVRKTMKGAGFRIDEPKKKEEKPPVEGAQKAPDGKWYLQKEGKWYRVD